MTPLKSRLISMIEASGPMPVSAFMETCLHDPKDGYYAAQPGLGRDFITAPETSQVFGELLGLWAAHEWKSMGAPNALNLIELGPGRGTLMADALRAGKTASGFVEAIRLNLVEASPALRKVQAKALAIYQPRFCEDALDAAGPCTLILANEFLDCLPARQFQNTVTGWHERVVGLSSDQDGLSFGLATDRIPISETTQLENGAQVLEVQPGLEILVDTLKQRQERGETFRALLIDYGPVSHTPGDTLRAYQDGEQIDPLAAPGLSDLTVDVDFARLKSLAKQAGLTVAGPISQGEFLMRLGVEARMQALIKAQPSEAEKTFESVRKLVDPAEMGQRFNVICISSPDLATPAGF